MVGLAVGLAVAFVVRTARIAAVLACTLAAAFAATLAGSVLGDLVRNGVTVWLDSKQSSAHNKVMIIDAGTPAAVLVTGSYNFTYSAQRRNAENVLVMRGNPDLAAAFATNWQRLRASARPYRARAAP